MPATAIIVINATGSGSITSNGTIGRETTTPEGITAVTDVIHTDAPTASQTLAIEADSPGYSTGIVEPPGIVKLTISSA
jgi:hypothetical protein